MTSFGYDRVVGDLAPIPQRFCSREKFVCRSRHKLNIERIKGIVLARKRVDALDPKHKLDNGFKLVENMVAVCEKEFHDMLGMFLCELPKWDRIQLRKTNRPETTLKLLEN